VRAPVAISTSSSGRGLAVTLEHPNVLCAGLPSGSTLTRASRSPAASRAARRPSIVRLGPTPLHERQILLLDAAPSRSNSCSARRAPAPLREQQHARTCPGRAMRQPRDPWPWGATDVTPSMHPRLTLLPPCTARPEGLSMTRIREYLENHPLLEPSQSIGAADGGGDGLRGTGGTRTTSPACSRCLGFARPE